MIALPDRLFMPAAEYLEWEPSQRQFQSLQEYVLVQVDRPKVEVFRRNENNQWVLSEYDLDNRLLLESIGVEIAIADLYRQVQFEANNLT
jgi:Uma2 family endonuclease